MRLLRIAALALGGLRRTRLRSALTVLGVTIASAALVSMVAFAVGLQRQMETPFKTLGVLNDIHLSARSDKDAPPLDDAALERMSGLPGVVVAYPDIRVKGIKVRHGDKTEAGLALAMPREASMFGVAEEILLAGRFFNKTSGPEVILGVQLIRGLGFASPSDAVGATVTVEAAGLSPDDARSFTFHRKELRLEVIGVYDVPPMMPALARRGIVLPVELMKEVPGAGIDAALQRLAAGGSAKASGYTRATVRVRGPADLDAVESAIREMGYDAHATLGHVKEMRVFFVLLQVLLAAVGTVALVVAGLGIVNTLLISVLERYQEIGIYKAVGASEGDLAVLFLTEAAILGLAGGLAGLALGWGVSWVLELAISAYAVRYGVTERLDLFAFPFWLLASTVLFAAVVSVMAGVYPAVRAARVDPIQALRRE
jgi:putative ABC transport system permease protein